MSWIWNSSMCSICNFLDLHIFWSDFIGSAWILICIFFDQHSKTFFALQHSALISICTIFTTYSVSLQNFPIIYSQIDLISILISPLDFPRGITPSHRPTRPMPLPLAYLAEEFKQTLKSTGFFQFHTLALSPAEAHVYFWH